MKRLCLTVMILFATTQSYAVQNCTYTQGFWKNHEMLWPIQDPGLCGLTWLEILNTPVAGNSWYNVAHQWIAATLNVENGAIPTPEVAQALEDAQNFLFPDNQNVCQITPEERADALAAKDILDEFNNGNSPGGPPHCDDLPDPGPTPTPTPGPTATPSPTTTPVPTPTPTPGPTATPVPTVTPAPSATPTPTATPAPTATPDPDTPIQMFASCSPLKIKLLPVEKHILGRLDQLKVSGRLAHSNVSDIVSFQLRNAKGVIAEATAACDFTKPTSCRLIDKDAKKNGGVNRFKLKIKPNFSQFQLTYYGNLQEATLPGMCLWVRFGGQPMIEMCGYWNQLKNGWKLPLEQARKWN